MSQLYSFYLYSSNMKYILSFWFYQQNSNVIFFKKWHFALKVSFKPFSISMPLSARGTNRSVARIIVIFSQPLVLWTMVRHQNRLITTQDPVWSLVYYTFVDITKPLIMWACSKSKLSPHHMCDLSEKRSSATWQSVVACRWGPCRPSSCSWARSRSTSPANAIVLNSCTMERNVIVIYHINYKANDVPGKWQSPQNDPRYHTLASTILQRRLIHDATFLCQNGKSPQWEGMTQFHALKLVWLTSLN